MAGIGYLNKNNSAENGRKRIGDLHLYHISANSLYAHSPIIRHH